MRILCLALLFAVTHLHATEPLRIAAFTADATPEIGMPVVLCAVDWHRQWRA